MKRAKMFLLLFHRMAVRLIVAVFAIAYLFASAYAADFAPAGAAATLTVKVKAVGGAKHKARTGAGFDAEEWKVNNSSQFTIRLKAMDPVGDDSQENQAKAEATRGAYKQAITEKDQEIIDKWEAKVDACSGNEACENKVQAQMFSDPQYQRIMMKMQGAAPEILGAAKAVDVSQRIQLWQTDPMDASPASGSLQLDMREDAYGVIDTGGGGKGNVSCSWRGTHTIKPNSADAKVGAFLRVDSKTSTFEIRIPAEAFSARLTESCKDSKTGSHGLSKNTRVVPLIGSAPGSGVKDFAQILTFKGKLGSVRSPQMQGKKTITTELFGGSSKGASVPLKVSIEWSFAAGGR